MKMIEVVAAIIERDGKIFSRNALPRKRSGGIMGVAGGKVEPDGETSVRRWCVVKHGNWASKQLLVTCCQPSAKFRGGLSIFMHGMPTSTGR